MDADIFHPPVDRICVIDTDPAVLDSMEAFIQTLGQRVQTFQCGRELQECWPAADLSHIICAAQLQDMQGVELYRWLRSNDCGIPFGLSVSAHQHALIDAAARAGIEHIFRKPLLEAQALVDFIHSSEH